MIAKIRLFYMYVFLHQQKLNQNGHLEDIMPFNGNEGEENMFNQRKMFAVYANNGLVHEKEDYKILIDLLVFLCFPVHL